MSDLTLYMGTTLVGYIFGLKLRSKKAYFRWTGKVQLLALMILVLLMGMRMGANDEIIKNIGTIGISAFIITLFVLFFSILCISVARRLMKIDKYGRVKAAKEEMETGEKNQQTENGKSINLMTIIILVAVIIGMATGYLLIRNIFGENIGVFDSVAGLGIRIGLCVLLLFVGLDLGMDETVVSSFKKVGLKIIAFPIATIVGSLVGAAIGSVIIGLSLKEGFAIGAGLGWYTLAPGIIMEAGYIKASAISFLHNVMRELFAIIFIPTVASKIGYVETISLPGAAAMDVCLPIVEKATRSEFAVYSFISGLVLSIAVPVMVPLIIG